jgi:predicted phosphodiesterase
VRTLVVSDLHLGAMGGRDVLRRPVALDILRAEVERADRLVLLGDVVELLEGRPRKAMSLAREPLRVLGDAMGRGGEVVYVAGNHDHSVVRPWLRVRRAEGKRLGLATRVPAHATAGLESLHSALGPVRLRVQYPGTWLSPAVYATHGHYVDRHLVPFNKGLLARGPLAPVPERGARAEDYERASGPSLDSLGAAVSLELPDPLAEGVERALGVLRRGAMAAGPVAAGVLRTEALAPLTAGALGLQFRRAGLPAMAAAAAGLGIRARHLIFGHLHRAGPLAGDDLGEWRPNDRGPRLWNSGSWVYEPLLLSRSRPPHPYWPGGAIVLEDDAEPRLLTLLDDVTPAALG